MKWQSADTAPTDGTRILVAEFDDHVSVAEWSGSYWIRDETYRGVDFSHWMPLPDPPPRTHRFRVVIGKDMNDGSNQDRP